MKWLIRLLWQAFNTTRVTKKKSNTNYSFSDANFYDNWLEYYSWRCFSLLFGTKDADFISPIASFPGSNFYRQPNASRKLYLTSFVEFSHFERFYESQKKEEDDSLIASFKTFFFHVSVEFCFIRTSRLMSQHETAEIAFYYNPNRKHSRRYQFPRINRNERILDVYERAFSLRLLRLFMNLNYASLYLFFFFLMKAFPMFHNYAHTFLGRETILISKSDWQIVPFNRCSHPWRQHVISWVLFVFPHTNQ